VHPDDRRLERGDHLVAVLGGGEHGDHDDDAVMK
jgi:hypothetical protein